ncbi:MAG TPA: isoaspartyl peptidase/L-asparaginase [Dictyobacter sp.]|jgi:beta-aspartyl-peptidase (threonine type)|nr:isoaspartyl peptidase/L-asparaginase [Dictyobacter sp.]
MSIAIVVHGGAGNITVDRHASAQEGCSEASLLGWQVLRKGGSALEAVETAVRVLESNPNFNAGTGACLNRDGKIELDAGIMEGHTLQVGSIAGVELIKHPITLARRVLESPHAFLMGKGAQQFAQEHEIPFCRFEDLLTERQYMAWKKGQSASLTQEAIDVPESEKHGTVGAVAIDSQGHLAAATSTGGILNKYPGRIGDTPVIGAGFYADEHAAISCTGYGEDFIRLVIAQRSASYVEHGASAREAAVSAMSFLSKNANGTGGLIIADSQGNVGFAWNSQNMAYAYLCGDMIEPIAGI